MILLLSYIATQIMEVLLGIGILYRIYPQLKIHKKGTWGIGIFCSLIVFLLYVINGIDSYISNIYLLFHSFAVSFIYFCFFEVKYVSALLIELLYMINIAILKLPIIIEEGIWEKATLFEINRGERTSVECVWCLIVLCFVYYITYKKKWENNLRTVIEKYATYIWLVAIIQWILLSYNMSLGLRGFQLNDLIINVVLIICALIYIQYLFLRLGYYELQLDYKQIDTSQKILQKQLIELQKLYKNNRTQIHEKHHDELYLYHCLENGENSEAIKFLKTHIDAYNDERKEVWTGFPFLDFILNYKLITIKEKEIEFRLQLDVYEYPFEDSEMGTLLGNLLDNAIEACEKCEKEKRRIFLHIWNKREMFMLRLKNSSVKVPEKKGERFISDKENTQAHGLGVEQVKHIIEKYDGRINFQYDSEYFEVTIIVSMRSKKMEVSL